MKMRRAMNIVEFKTVASRGADADCLSNAGSQPAADDAGTRISAFLNGKVDDHPCP